MKHLKRQFVQHPAAALESPERRRWMHSVRQQIRACDWHERDAQGREPQEFVVMHPLDRAAWLKNGPCEGCPCEPWCDTPCSLRLRWWNDVVGVVRRRLRG